MTQHVPGPERRWNHNTHFHARVLDAVPAPPRSYAQVQHTARAVLMGSEYRRHPLWRYVITWRRPR